MKKRAYDCTKELVNEYILVCIHTPIHCREIKVMMTVVKTELAALYSFTPKNMPFLHVIRCFVCLIIDFFYREIFFFLLFFINLCSSHRLFIDICLLSFLSLHPYLSPFLYILYILVNLRQAIPLTKAIPKYRCITRYIHVLLTEYEL